MRPARPDEIPAIREFLLHRAASSMFPLSNLDRYGHEGGHPRAVSFWIATKGQSISDVLTISDEGMVFPQCPNGPWPDVVPVLRQTGVKGFIGEASQVKALQGMVGTMPKAGLDMFEPHYQLTLQDLSVPDSRETDLIALGAAPRALVCDWRAAFCEEAMNFPPDDARIKGRQDIASFVRDDTHRVLVADGRPVAMTGFNAVLPQIVQVGGVYTPPALRGLGYARQAVALHLAEARTKGVVQAVLSAATPAAARAYEAIGFRRVGDFWMVIWADRQAVAHG